MRTSLPSRLKFCADLLRPSPVAVPQVARINIVTKQATTAGNFYNMDTTFGTDRTKRVVLDVNQVISPTLAVRAGGLFQDASVAGRDYATGQP